MHYFIMQYNLYYKLKQYNCKAITTIERNPNIVVHKTCQK